MFTVQQVTETYNRRGAVVRTERHEVFASADPLETVRFRYRTAYKGGYWVRPVTDRNNVTLVTLQDGQEIGFQDLFRIVEGQEAFDAVMSGAAEPVAEELWIAGKA